MKYQILIYYLAKDLSIFRRERRSRKTQSKQIAGLLSLSRYQKSKSKYSPKFEKYRGINTLRSLPSLFRSLEFFTCQIFGAIDLQSKLS